MDIRLGAGPTKYTWMDIIFFLILTGKEKEGPRREIFYFSDDGDLTAFRYNDWKLIFMEQRAPGTLKTWSEPFVSLRLPMIYNLRRDPYEFATITSNTYYDWLLDHAFLLVPAQEFVGKFLMTFQGVSSQDESCKFYPGSGDGATDNPG